MRHYIETFPENRHAWLQLCINRRSGTILQSGDKVKLTTENEIIHEDLNYYFGDKTYTVNGVIRKKWELMPCDHYVTLNGLNGMFLNTIFDKI